MSADSQTSPAKRQGTMEQTAKEGVEYLKEAGKESLIKAQGLEKIAENGSASGSSPQKVERTDTIKETIAEGKEILEEMGGAPDPEAKTRAQQDAIEEAEAKKDAADDGSPHKTASMKETIEEAKEILGGEKYGETRSETEEIQSPSHPKRTHAIEETLEEAKEFLEGEDDAPPPAKATKTMEETVKEGEAFVNGAEGSTE